MIASKWGGLEGIKFRICNHEFVGDVTTSVMPQNGAGITDETATGGIAFSARANEINARTTDEEVRVVIKATFAVVAFAPKRQGIITVSNNVTVDNDGTRG